MDCVVGQLADYALGPPTKSLLLTFYINHSSVNATNVLKVRKIYHWTNPALSRPNAANYIPSFVFGTTEQLADASTKILSVVHFNIKFSNSMLHCSIRDARRSISCYFGIISVILVFRFGSIKFP